MKKESKTIVRLKLKKPWEVGYGHMPKRSGSGIHQDKRSKRLNTRAAKNRKAINENL